MRLIYAALNYTLMLMLMTSTLSINGCLSSNGTEDSVSSTEEDSEIIISLTDAEGDFLSYTVDVLSVKLTKLNGTEVETLPLSTKVDFAQYTEVTEFLTAATVPSGIYTDASITLDYSAAQIVVEDSTGNAVNGTAIDLNGNPIDTLELKVQLANRDHFRIAPGIPAHITLDFDLEASHEVDLSTSPALVTVEPVLIADTLLEDPKQHRLRGLLDEVNVNEEIFSVKIRPFYHFNGHFGHLRVHVDTETAYEIDGVQYIGNDGLQQLSLSPENTAMIILGQLARNASGDQRHYFKASHVQAGSSVPWGDKDLLSGHVIARNNDTITLKGATLIRADNDVVFGNTVTITIGDDTKITKQGGFGEILDKFDISVGQRIDVIGTISNDVAFEVDASAGHIRLLYTNLNGTVVQVSPLVINLQAIGRHRVSIFDFIGTGTSEDADPTNYEIDSGTLSLSGLDIDAPVKIRGFVNRFGEAPPDFNAQTIIDLQNMHARMNIRWDETGSSSPFISSSSENIVVDLTDLNMGNLHHVFRAGVATDLLSLGTDVTLSPSDSQQGLYAIVKRGAFIMVYHDFARFEAALSSELDGTTVIKALHSRGKFNDSDSIFTGKGAIIRLQ